MKALSHSLSTFAALIACASADKRPSGQGGLRKLMFGVSLEVEDTTDTTDTTDDTTGDTTIGAEDDVECTDPSYTLTMYDSYGDGWNDAAWTWTSADGEVVDSGTLADGSSATAAICDDSTGGCPTLSVSEGGYPTEISWSVADANGKELGAGEAGTTVDVCAEVPSAAPTTSPLPTATPVPTIVGHGDIGPPEYVANSLALNLTHAVLDGHDVQYITVSWELREDSMMSMWGGVYTRLVSDTGAYTNGLQEYGYPGLETLADDDGATYYRATISLVLTEYRATANYGPSMIMMDDVAGNSKYVTFSDSASDEPQSWVYVSTPNPDTAPPELDLNNITVSAVPTQPDAPNGETQVSITYRARDDKSGLDTVSYRLLDPQGTSHFEYHYHENTYTTFFDGDPTSWSTYTISVVLPVGSAPGTWGLESMELSDKVDNTLSSSFVENAHFDVEADDDAAVDGRRLRTQPQTETHASKISPQLRFEVA